MIFDVGEGRGAYVNVGKVAEASDFPGHLPATFGDLPETNQGRAASDAAEVR